jgi:gliding motility-associatede transport system auxiliary component
MMRALRGLLGYAGLAVMVSGGALLRLRPDATAWGYALLGTGILALLVSVWWNGAEWISFFSGRSVRFGANAILYILVVALILYVVNRFAQEHPIRVDTTEAGLYTLSAETLQVLGSLDDDVEVKAFFFEDASKDHLERLLREFERHTDRLQVDWIDPDLDPAEVKAFDVRVAGTTVFVHGDRETKVTEISEQGVTRGLLEVMREGESTACFISGHGERSIADTGPPGYSQAREAMEKSGLLSLEVELLREVGLPPECDVLAVVGPKVSFLPAEVEAVGRYLAEGGRALLLLDPDEPSGLDPVLAQFGVRRVAGLLLDPVMQRLAGFGAEVPVASTYTDTEITRNLELPTLFPLASGLTVEAEGGGALSLVESSVESWSETDRAALLEGRASLDPGQDTPGPLALAVQVVRPAAASTTLSGEMRLVVVGDSDFAANQYFNLLGNADLFLNAVTWLAQKGAQVEIPPRASRPRLLTLTGGEAGRLLFFTLVLYPLGVLGVGIFQWARRRKL